MILEERVSAKSGGGNETQAQVLATLHAHVGVPKPQDDVELGHIYCGNLTLNKGSARRWRELGKPALVDEVIARLDTHLANWGYAP